VKIEKVKGKSGKVEKVKVVIPGFNDFVKSAWLSNHELKWYL
jgi:hypothetical protein